jgi:hypothetical protein
MDDDDFDNIIASVDEEELLKQPPDKVSIMLTEDGTGISFILRKKSSYHLEYLLQEPPNKKS